jgi:hypothetical protein
VLKSVLSVEVIDVRLIWICGGSVPGGRVVEGGSFSLLVEWLEVVLVWEEVSPAVVWDVKEGTVWEDGRGCGTVGRGKSLCTI